MIPKSKVWYHKGEARECLVLSCYLLQLELDTGEIVNGYYYCGQFYCGAEKITDRVRRWMIPKVDNEGVRLN